jgi:hypothetical protein
MSTSLSPPHLQQQKIPWDVAMREALHRESQEALRHQLDVERHELGRGSRNDAFFAVGFLGVAIGLGYAVGAFRPPKVVRALPGKIRKSTGMTKRRR